ncbi:hypothetical protein GCM10009819_18290 [Agromyces tropicus]|uniref:DUF3099 domain-containing protein n=1 Tax=Agromyces tropicus TaxID=555371 RepID=A0ABP5FUK6_9MICO
MIGDALSKWWSRPGVRLRIARVVVVVGVVLGVFGVLSGRYGFLFAGIVIVGLGAGLGPARIRKRREER